MIAVLYEYLVGRTRYEAGKETCRRQCSYKWISSATCITASAVQTSVCGSGGAAFTVKIVECIRPRLGTQVMAHQLPVSANMEHYFWPQP